MTERASRRLRRRHRRAQLARGRRRRRFSVERFGIFETPHETRTVHEIPRG